MVRPGKYRAELNINGKIYSAEFQILMDPKIVKSGLSIHNLQTQETLALKVRSLLNESKIMAYQLRDEKVGPMLEVKTALVTAKGPYPQPMLIDQAKYLSSMINRVDQLPGTDAFIRYDELRFQFELLKKSYNEFTLNSNK
jgi:hypothetical protein